MLCYLCSPFFPFHLILCANDCQCLWIIQSWLLFRFSLTLFVAYRLSYVLFAQCSQCLWIVHTWLPLRFSLTFIYYLEFVLCLVYPVLPVSLDCPYFIASLVFSNVYLLPRVCPMSCVPSVASVSGMSVPNCRLGFLWRLFTTYSLSCVLYAQCCQCLWIVHSWLLLRVSLMFIYCLEIVQFRVCPVSLDCTFLITLPLRFSLTFIHYLECVLCLVYPVLSVSLDCPFWIAASVFYDVYLLPTVCRVYYVPSVSELSILVCSFGFSNIYLLSRDCPISCVPSVSGLYICDYIASSVFSNVYSISSNLKSVVYTITFFTPYFL